MFKVKSIYSKLPELKIMTTATTLSLVRSFKDPITKAIGATIDEIHHFLDDGITTYVENYRSKFRFGKTFLFQKQNVKFDDIYFPITLQSGTTEYKVENIQDLYLNANFTLIIGGAGSGKSMQLKYIFLKSLEQKIKIPIFIELKSLNEYNGSLEEFIHQKISKTNLSKNKGILRRILSSGEFLFILDGYDELYSNRKQKITQELELFIDANSKNWFIVASRPEAGFESFPRFRSNYIQPLNTEEIDDFIDLQCDVIKDQNFAENVKNTIKESDNTVHLDFLGSPLLLSMFLFTFKNHPYLPNSRSRFYWNVIETLMIKHDSFTKKGGWQHERQSGLSNERIENIVKLFSFVSLIEGKIEFEKKYLRDKLIQVRNKLSLNYNVDDLIYDLVVSTGLIHQDGIKYKFIHRSIQEYLTSLLISEQKDIGISKKIYHEKLSGYGKRFRTGSNLVFDLLVEMDENRFYRYYVLHNLNLIYSTIYSDDTERMVSNYLKFTKASFHVVYNTSDYEKLEIMSLKAPGSHYIDLLKYLGLVQSQFLLTGYMEDYANNDAFSADIKKALNECKTTNEMLWINFDSHSDLDCEYFIESSSIVDDVNRILNDIKFKISEIEAYLDTKLDKNIDLFDF